MNKQTLMFFYLLKICHFFVDNKGLWERVVKEFKNGVNAEYEPP